MKWWLRRGGIVVGISMLCLVFLPTAGYAEIAQSPHYQIDESTIGSGGLLQSSSANYSSSSSLGDLAVGSSSSSNYQLQSGSKTTNDPALGFSIPVPTASFGAFSASTAATATASFSISDYTSYGYIVQIVGKPLSSGTNTIAPMATTGPSQVGVDQFGINLVANTSPTTFGANPNTGQFGAGVATTGYNTPNQFRYVDGETIAQSPKSSGVTTYTISYLVNVKALDPGGVYSSNQTLIITPTY